MSGPFSDRPPVPYGASVKSDIWRWQQASRSPLVHRGPFHLEPFSDLNDPDQIEAGLTWAGCLPWNTMHCHDILDRIRVDRNRSA